jgi:hypothetical protein
VLGRDTCSVGSADAVSLLRAFKRLLRFLAPKGVWFGLGLAVAATFEQTLRNGEPIWSSVYGFPILHHVWLAFIILAVSLLISGWKRDASENE